MQTPKFEVTLSHVFKAKNIQGRRGVICSIESDFRIKGVDLADSLGGYTPPCQERPITMHLLSGAEGEQEVNRAIKPQASP